MSYGGLFAGISNGEIAIYSANAGRSRRGRTKETRGEARITIWPARNPLPTKL